MKLSKP